MNKINQKQVKSVRQDCIDLEQQMTKVEERTNSISKLVYNQKIQWDAGDKTNIDSDTLLANIILAKNGDDYYTSGVFISYVIDTGAYQVKPISIEYTHNKPLSTTIYYYTRTGNTETPDASWSEWQITSVTDTIQSAAGRYIQFKVELNTANVNYTPSVSMVTLCVHSSGGTQELYDARGGYKTLNERLNAMGSLTIVEYTATEGQTDFDCTLTPVDDKLVKVYVNGILEREGIGKAYTIVGNLVRFGSGLLDGGEVITIYIEGSAGVVTDNNDSVNALSGIAVFNPVELLSGESEQTTVTVGGAQIGDIAMASFDQAHAGINIWAQVTAENTVTVTFFNFSDTTINLGSGTILVKVSTDLVVGNIVDNAITTSKIIDNAITTSKITDQNVTTSKIADKAVTLAKMADIATGSVIYRKTAGTGVPEVQSLDTLKYDLDFMTGMNRQAIIDGNFQIAQVNPTVGTEVTNPANLTYPICDMYKVLIDGNGGTFPNIYHSQQLITPGSVPGSKFSYKKRWDGAGSNFGPSAYDRITHYIENGTQNLCGAGKKVTVSFWAKSDIVGKKIGIEFFQQYGTGGSPSSGEIPIGSYFTLTNTWKKYTCTFETSTLVGKTFGTNNDDYIRLCVWYMWGSSLASRLGDTVAETYVGSGSVEIAQLQLCAGSVALPFQPKSFQEELRDCQRYFYVYASDIGSRFGPPTLAVSTDLQFFYPLSEMMRVAPTVSLAGTRGTDWQLRDAGDGVNTTGTLITSCVSKNNARIIFSSGTFNAGTLYHIIKITSTHPYLFSADARF